MQGGRMMERFADNNIRIAYENRCYGDILVAVEKDIKKAIIKAKQEVFNDIEKIMFNKHYHKGVYIRYMISDIQFQDVKAKHL